MCPIAFIIPASNSLTLAAGAPFLVTKPLTVDKETGIPNSLAVGESPILNRGIQPATFPKALLILIIGLTFIVYFLSTKKPWKNEKKLPKPFYLTLVGFILFILISKTLDFFLAISVLSVFVSYYWGERRFFYLLLVSIIFPIIVFIFFETILGLRFPPGIITNIYYQV